MKIVCYSSVKNSSSAYKAHIFMLLKLCYICWGSPDEHFAVCPTSATRKTTEIHGVEVDQSSLSSLTRALASFRMVQHHALFSRTVLQPSFAAYITLL